MKPFTLHPNVHIKISFHHTTPSPAQTDPLVERGLVKFTGPPKKTTVCQISIATGESAFIPRAGGVAFCAHTDQPDRAEGRKHALRRALVALNKYLTKEGLGLTPGDLHRIWDEYFKAHGSEVRRHVSRLQREIRHSLLQEAFHSSLLTTSDKLSGAEA